jgi:hypothetical protein
MDYSEMTISVAEPTSRRQFALKYGFVTAFVNLSGLQRVLFRQTEVSLSLPQAWRETLNIKPQSILIASVMAYP